MVEYTTGAGCRTPRVDGFLFGTGERLGVWDAFKLFYAIPSDSRLRSLECSQRVVVSNEDDAIVIRILRGSKAAGRAAECKTQQCYYVLLKVGAHFKYAALQHVRGSTRTSADDADISLEWLDDTSFEGEPPTANQLADFRPKSVSAVAKAAAQYASQLNGSGGNAHSGARGSTRGGSRGGSRGGVRAVARAALSQQSRGSASA